ncbi:hypothetical protein WN48_06727 [Eufriesea mexicana]|uniref:Uncharacterized protein n=1 Tax=Eufriesea mexicana TaxID=516756 RepID=A0A310SLP8_9HYME|nr:hypothetical protein WN48_06727 [Eufriesea mexicana]
MGRTLLGSFIFSLLEAGKYEKMAATAFAIFRYLKLVINDADAFKPPYKLDRNQTANIGVLTIAMFTFHDAFFSGF